jgi:hypothetical protein
MEGEREFKSHDMIKVLHLSHEGKSGLEIEGAGREPVRNPILFLEMRAM